VTEPAEPEWLDQKTAARRLSVSTRTLRSWTRGGVVAVHELPGGLRRYRVTELDELARPVCERAAG
jgi:predicted site-specific integrase-resolvase